MAYLNKPASLAILLALLLSLRSIKSFSLNPSHHITRIKPVHIASPSPFSTSYVHHRRRYRRTALGVVDAPPLDDWEPNNDNSSRLKASSVATLANSCYTGYLHLCEKRPFLTNSIAAGVLAGVGDILAQSLCVGSTAVGISSFNWVRWRTFMLTGLLFEGPWMTFWYMCLKKVGRWMESKYQSGPRQQVLGQVVVGQTLGVAIFYPAFFVVYESIGAIMSGQVPNLHNALVVCRADLLAVLWTQYKVWPLVDWINFTYVPEPLRVFFCSFVTLFWNIYLAGAVAT